MLVLADQQTLIDFNAQLCHICLDILLLFPNFNRIRWIIFRDQRSCYLGKAENFQKHILIGCTSLNLPSLTGRVKRSHLFRVVWRRLSSQCRDKFYHCNFQWIQMVTDVQGCV